LNSSIPSLYIYYTIWVTSLGPNVAFIIINIFFYCC